LEKKDIPNISRSPRIFLSCNVKMKWRVVKCFYIQMRQHLTFSIVSEGLGSFIKKVAKDLFPKNLNKELSRGRNKHDGATTKSGC
jgi:hypothetical protein